MKKIARLAAAAAMIVTPLKVNAQEYLHSQPSDEALAYTNEGDEIVNPAHDSATDIPHPKASYSASNVIKYEVKIAHMTFYELRAQFVRMSEDGECLFTYHDIPSLQKALLRNPSAKLAKDVHRAIDDLQAMAVKFKNAPDTIADGKWGPVIDKQDCPVSYNQKVQPSFTFG